MEINNLKWYSTWKKSNLNIDDWNRYLPEMLRLIEQADWVRPLKLPGRLMIAENVYINTPFVLVDLSKKIIKVLEYYTRARLGGIGRLLQKQGLDTKILGRSCSGAERWISEDFSPMPESMIVRLFQIMQEIHDNSSEKDRKYLPTDIEQFFYNKQSGVSWFLRCLDMYLNGEVTAKKLSNGISDELIVQIALDFIPEFFTGMFGVSMDSLAPELSKLEQWFPRAAMIIVNSQNDGGESFSKWYHLCAGNNASAGAWWVRMYLRFMSSGDRDMGYGLRKMLEPGSDMMLNFLYREAKKEGMKTDFKYMLLNSLN